jgi:hypothetical protein
MCLRQLCDMLFAAQTGKLDILQEALDKGGIDVNETDCE